MNFKIDNLQYCNWSREILQFNRSAGLDAVHVTIVYHEDYNELLTEIKKWEIAKQKVFNKETMYFDAGFVIYAKFRSWGWYQM